MLPGLQMADAPSISSDKSCEQNGAADNTKPPGLVESGRDRELDGIAVFIPNPVGITCHDAKLIGRGAQVGIKGLTTISRILPIWIITFQLVFVTDPGGIIETETGVVNYAIPDSFGKL